MADMTKLLIGYDGSESTKTILRDLKWAGLPARVEAVVLSAAEVFMPPPPDDSTLIMIRPVIERSRQQGQDALRKAGFLAEEGAQKIKALFPDWNVTAEPCADTSAWALVKKAEEWKADLIAVGAHSHSRMGRFMGSVSQMVSIHAPCSVRVGRPRPYPQRDALKILVAIDGSPDSETAVKAVQERVWPAHSQIFLVSVIDPKRAGLFTTLTPSVIRWFLDKGDDEKTVLGRMLEGHAKKLRENVESVTCLVKTGNPADVLVDEATAWGVDCIFMGARGLSQMKRFLIGGVSSAVAASAHCSVEIVRSINS